MKLSELTRLQLENIVLKLQLINTQAVELNSRAEKLQAEQKEIVLKFCEENKLDIEKTRIDITSGEIIEDLKEE